MNLPRLLFRGLDRLNHYFNVLAMVSLGVMSALIIVEVFVRLFFNASTLISEEWSGYLLIYLVFFGLAHAFKSDAFITVDIVYNRLSQMVREKVRLCCILLALIFIVIFEYELVIFVLSTYQKHLRSVSFSETPLVIPQIAMPIGIALLGLQLLKEFIARILSWKGITLEKGVE